MDDFLQNYMQQLMFFKELVRKNTSKVDQCRLLRHRFRQNISFFFFNFTISFVQDQLLSLQKYEPGRVFK